MKNNNNFNELYQSNDSQEIKTSNNNATHDLIFFTKLPPTPTGMGPLSLLFYTAGVLLLQIAVLAFYGMLSHGKDISFVELGFSFISSGLWAGAAAFVVRKKLVPHSVISLSFSKIKPRVLFIIPIIGILLLMAGSALESIVIYFIPSLFKPDPVLSRLVELFYSSPLYAIAVIFLSVVIAPITEEFFFRGLMFKSLRYKGYGFWYSSLFTSIIFAAVHVKPIGFTTLVLVSLVLSYFTEKTGSIASSILLHGTYNAIVLGVGILQGNHTGPTLDTNQQQLVTPESIFSIIPIAFIFILLIILMCYIAFNKTPLDSQKVRN